MNKLIGSLDGKKTYLTCLVAGGLLFGAWQGWWKIPPEIYAGLAALATAFLRAGVDKAASPRGGGARGGPEVQSPPAATAGGGRGDAPKAPLGLLVALAALGLGLWGCQTQNPAGRSLATIAVTVDHAMQGWAACVADGQVSDQQQQEVASAYRKYQLAMQAAEAAYSAATATGDSSLMDQALAALQASEQDLAALIAAFSATPAKTNAPPSITR